MSTVTKGVFKKYLKKIKRRRYYGLPKDLFTDFGRSWRV